MTQFFKQFVEETKVTMRRISKKYTEKAEREKNIKKGNHKKRETIEMPLSQDTYAALNCVLLLKAQTRNLCVCACVCRAIYSI